MTRQAYWLRQRKRILILLAVWAIAGLGMGVLFVEPLNTINFGGIPFGFWMAQQGSIFVFVSLILIYALASDRADREAGLEEEPGTTSDAMDAH
ncbi:MAG: DUF4212 domain-containing protein [Rhodothermales bacterium]